jgi:excisionase family DNA binding protein
MSERAVAALADATSVIDAVEYMLSSDQLGDSTRVPAALGVIRDWRDRRTTHPNGDLTAAFKDVGEAADEPPPRNTKRSSAKANDVVRESTPLTLTVTAASRYSGLSEWTIRKLINEGKIQHRRHGSRVLVMRDSVDGYVNGLPSERESR